MVILMGCSTLYLRDIAQAFISRGASAILGWDASVLLDYVDEATMELIANLEGRCLKQAVERTMTEVGPDPIFKARLIYYPEGRRDFTLTQTLLREREFGHAQEGRAKLYI